MTSCGGRSRTPSWRPPGTWGGLRPSPRRLLVHLRDVDRDRPRTAGPRREALSLAPTHVLPIEHLARGRVFLRARAQKACLGAHGACPDAQADARILPDVLHPVSAV